MDKPHPSVSHAVARVRAWLSANGRDKRRSLAEAAGVDEKTLRLAVSKSWNPTVNTLRKLEALIPPNWPSDQVKRKDAKPAREAA